jgi:hypothetical protein
MKNVKLLNSVWMSMVMLLSFSITANAADILPRVSLKSIPTEQKITIKVQNLKENHTVTLLDVAGVVLMKEQTGEQDTYAKLLNLENLDKGSYFVIVENSLRKQVYPFTLTNKGAEIKEYQAKTYYKPVVRVQKEYLDISMFNGMITNVNVTIYGQGVDPLFTERFENALTIERRYKLKDFPRGKYKIKVATPENTYVEYFEVR